MDDLLKNLRALAKGKHDDYSVALEAIREIERLKSKNHQLLIDLDILSAERDSLLLDAHDFVGWFNRSYAEPSTHPEHPWNVICGRLQAMQERIDRYCDSHCVWTDHDEKCVRNEKYDWGNHWQES